jgi:DNA polymerase-1
VDALLAVVRDGRIHASYQQTIDATGRLGSSDPDLRTIAAETEDGRRLREAFPAPPGQRLVSAGYSELELRVLAHLSADPTLIEAFRSGEDIHRRTAAEVFGVDPEAVTAEQRRAGRVVNFAVPRGIGPARLARELEIPFDQAESLVRDYLARLPGVSGYMRTTLEEARARGYVTTLLGRRRYVPDLSSPAGVARQLAERTALATPIQGTAADLIKAAMVAIDRRLARECPAAAMVLQVDDQLLFEVPEPESERVSRLVREEMGGVAALAVPLEVAIGIGSSWAEVR